MMRLKTGTLLLIIALGIFAACGESTKTPNNSSPSLPTSRIEQILAMAPIQFVDRPITFADYANLLSNTIGFDESEPMAHEELNRRIGQYFEEHGRRIYNGMQVPEPFSEIPADLIGLPRFSTHVVFNRGIWHSWDGSTSPTFIAIEGRYDSDLIPNRLLETGYASESHNRTPYYRLHEDFTAPLTHNLRNFALPINRIALIDELFLSAPATDIMANLIDVQSGSSRSLLESRPHQALTSAAGDGLLSGTLWTPQWVIDKWIEGKGNLFPDSYLEGPDKWDSLSTYVLSLRGYRVENEIQEIIIGLFYDDIDMAAKDESKLIHRWNTFAFEQHDNFPVTQVCSPLSTEVVEQDEYSILVASCPVLRFEGQFGLLETPALWTFLPHWFLYPDLDELKRAAEE